MPPQELTGVASVLPGWRQYAFAACSVSPVATEKKNEKNPTSRRSDWTTGELNSALQLYNTMKFKVKNADGTAVTHFIQSATGKRRKTDES